MLVKSKMPVYFMTLIVCYTFLLNMLDQVLRLQKILPG